MQWIRCEKKAPQLEAEEKELNYFFESDVCRLRDANVRKLEPVKITC
jgi:hypothetical protein